MKKILTIVLSLVMVFSMFSVLALNAAEADVTVTAEYQINGDKLDVVVSAASANADVAFCALKVVLKYDQNCLTIDEALLDADGKSFVKEARGDLLKEFGNKFLNLDTTDASRIMITGASAENIEVNEGVLATISFNITGELSENFIQLMEDNEAAVIDEAFATVSSSLVVAEKAAVAADLTALNKAIADAEAVKEADYTAESYKALADAVKAGKDLVASAPLEDAQADVDAAAKAINDAIAALVKVEVVDKFADLKAAVADAEAVKEADYTAESYKALKDAIATAKEVIAKEDATDEEIAAALAAIETAKKNLKPVTTTPVDPDNPTDPDNPGTADSLSLIHI